MSKQTQKLEQLNRLVVEYNQRKQYEQAIQAATEARDLAMELAGRESPDYAMALNNLAAIYYGLGQYAVARPRYEQALAIRRRVYGDHHPAVGLILFNLG